ncbi:hypothetical protein G3I60_07265 [Streptomyces sp. SID13666]|uniref:hypothetical protein n=1 Tax=unclassified Streptomyces TaxID=2593676 RepID=UPI0013C1CCBD|nr:MULTISPECIES: hypothetical protein [unclassified Streptomyces]MCZ4097431.1 hypothetical protein [Streptomyces sp. H39-C1]NEA53958.1 hypothetical protein [Streptomyces sp. SID13666]
MATAYVAYGLAPNEAHTAESVCTSEKTVALTFALVVINGWNRLAAGLHAPVTSLDGLDLPPNIPGASRS